MPYGSATAVGLDGGVDGERELCHGPVELGQGLCDVGVGELRVQDREPGLRGISVKIRQVDGGGGSSGSGGRGSGLLLISGWRKVSGRRHVCLGCV